MTVLENNVPCTFMLLKLFLHDIEKMHHVQENDHLHIEQVDKHFKKKKEHKYCNTQIHYKTHAYFIN
jgi:S-adenosylmethionine synthetase